VATFLRWLSRQRAWKIFGFIILLSVITSPLSATVGSRILQGIAATVGLGVLFGYPAAVILGFPEPFSTAGRRRILWIAVSVLAASVISTIEGEGITTSDWVRAVIAVPLTIVVCAPFFIATSVIGDARRALGSYKVGDCIGTWVSVMSYPLLGVFFIQGQVAANLHALDLRQADFTDHILDGRDA
jgi:hypothetical protein